MKGGGEGGEGEGGCTYLWCIYYTARCAPGTVRLVSESGSYFRQYGRVELCINETWTTICDEHWDDIDASVVCHQLGYSRYGMLLRAVHVATYCAFNLHVGAIASRDIFTERVWPLGVTNISCTGDEDNLLQCDYDTQSSILCQEHEDASVICQCMKFC
jgi:deleted-in-malignant-brain-tumors protein 1